MLCWNLYGTAATVPKKASTDHLLLSGWININSGIEADGSNVSPSVLEGIYRMATRERVANLLPVPDKKPVAAASARLHLATNAAVQTAAEGDGQREKAHSSCHLDMGHAEG